MELSQADIEKMDSLVNGLSDDDIAKMDAVVDSDTLGNAVITPELRGQNGEVVTPASVEYPTERTEKGQVSKRGWLHPVDFAKSFVKGGIRGQTSFLEPVFNQIENKGRELLGKRPLTDYEFENRRAKVLGKKENGGAYNVGKFIGETAPMFTLPETNIARLGTWGNRALTFGYQGGLGGELNSLAEKGWNPKENLKDAAIGAVGAIALGSAVSKGADKIARLQRAKDVMKRRNTPLAERLTEEQKENIYTNRSINKRIKELEENPELINDDNFYKGMENLSEEEQNLLLGAVDDANNKMNVADIKEKRAQNRQAKADEIAKIQTERNEALKGASFNNPSAKINKIYDKKIREAQIKYNKIDKDLRQQIKDLTPKKTDLNSLKSDIGEVMFSKEESTHEYATRSHKNKFYRQSVDDPMTYDIKEQMQAFNKYVQEIKNNPEIINDETFMARFNNDFNSMKQKMPDFMEQEFDDRLNQLMGKAREYNEFKANRNNPPEWEEITEAEYNALNNPVDDVADDIPPVAEEVTPKTTIEGTGELKNRGLAESVASAEGTPKEVRQAIRNDMPQYRVLHNNELTEQAVKEVEADFNNELSRLSSSKDFDALDYEKSNQIIRRLFDLGRNKEAINLIDNVADDATKKGQAIQALSLWSNMTPEGVVAKAEKLVRQANKKLPKKKQIDLSDEQIEKLRSLGKNIVNTEPGTRENDIAVAQAMKATSELLPKGILKKLDSYRYINMLLSGKSRFKDFILTGINSLDSAIDESIANGIDIVRSGITGKPKVYGGLQPKAWGKGFKKGWNEAKEDIQLGINTARSGETGRYGLPSTRSFNYTSIKDLSKNPLIAAKQLGEDVLALGEDGLSYTIRVPDRAFYEGRYASSIADQMKVTEKARNKEIAKLTEKLNKTNNQSEIESINKKIEQLNQPTQDMIIQAQKEALKAVFQDKSWVSELGNKTRELVNSGTERLQQALRLPFELPKIGNFIEPFVTTPANIANIGIENTAGGIPGIAQMLTAKTPGELRDAEMLVAKNIKGLIAGGLLGEGIYQGAIKSNFGKDDYQANNVSGLKPQSLVIGDKAISLKDYPQLSIPINTYLGLREGGIPKAVANVGRAVGDISALKGIGDLMNSFKPAYPGQELEAKDIVNNIIRKEGVNLISQFIPFGGALGELRNDIDPYSREMYMPTGETNKEMFDNTLQYAQNRLMNRLPGVSRMLPIKYNALGQPTMINNIKNPVARVLSEDLDFGVRNYNENDTYNKLAKFKESIKDTDYKGKTNVGVDVPKRSVNVNGENIKLNNKQYSRFTKDFGKINYKLKDWAINSDEFNNMSDEEKVDYLNKIKQSAEEAVKIMQFNHEPKKKLKEYTQYILDNWYDLTSDN